MEKEIKKVTGEIQNIKGNNFTIENIWYNNKFKKLPREIIKGKLVEVEYIVKNDNNYWQSVKITELKFIKQELNNELKIIEKKSSNLEIPYQVKDTILMNVKDILVNEIQTGDYNYTPEELSIKIKKLTKDFTEAYKEI